MSLPDPKACGEDLLKAVNAIKGSTLHDSSMHGNQADVCDVIIMTFYDSLYCLVVCVCRDSKDFRYKTEHSRDVM